MKPQWLAWARDLESVAQNGRHYAKDHYDIQRYETVRRIAAEIPGLKLSIARTNHRQLERFFPMSSTGDWTPWFD